MITETPKDVGPAWEKGAMCKGKDMRGAMCKGDLCRFPKVSEHPRQ